MRRPGPPPGMIDEPTPPILAALGFLFIIGLPLFGVFISEGPARIVMGVIATYFIGGLLHVIYEAKKSRNATKL